jgi:hypothetical protein
VIAWVAVVRDAAPAFLLAPGVEAMTHEGGKLPLPLVSAGDYSHCHHDIWTRIVHR